MERVLSDERAGGEGARLRDAEFRGRDQSCARA